MWFGSSPGKWRNSQCNFFLGHPLYMANLNPIHMFLTKNMKLWWYRFLPRFFAISRGKIGWIEPCKQFDIWLICKYLASRSTHYSPALDWKENFLFQNWDCPEIAICNVRRSRSVPNNLVSICSMHPIGRFSSRLSWYLCSNFSWPCQKLTHTDLCFVQLISVTWAWS